jgi:hypothetical protein
MRLGHLVPMDAMAKGLKKRARNRGRALKRSLGSVAGQSAKPSSSHAGKKRVTVHLPADKWRELKILVTMLDTTMDALMRCGLDRVLAERKIKVCKRA